MQETQEMRGFDPWVRKIPWSRKWQRTPVLLPGKFYEQRSLVRSQKSWTWLSARTHTHTHTHTHQHTHTHPLDGFPGGLVVKNPLAKQEAQVWSLGWEDPLEKEMATHSRILPGKSHEQRSLMGYSPWGHKGVRLDLVTNPPNPLGCTGR